MLHLTEFKFRGGVWSLKKSLKPSSKRGRAVFIFKVKVNADDLVKEELNKKRRTKILFLKGMY